MTVVYKTVSCYKYGFLVATVREVLGCTDIKYLYAKK